MKHTWLSETSIIPLKTRDVLIFIVRAIKRSIDINNTCFPKIRYLMQLKLQFMHQLKKNFKEVPLHPAHCQKLPKNLTLGIRMDPLRIRHVPISQHTYEGEHILSHHKHLYQTRSIPPAQPETTITSCTNSKPNSKSYMQQRKKAYNQTNWAYNYSKGSKENHAASF